MIGALSGTLIHRSEKHCIIEVNGVGYKVFASPETMDHAAAATNIFLYIHTVVREDALELFGFLDEMSLDMFERLVSVSGIGPRSALGVLSLAGTESLRNAIVNGDIVYLTKMSGIGKKTAEKILLELRDTLTKDYSHVSKEMLDAEADVLEALVSLGYNNNAIREVLKNIDKKGTPEQKIKQALKHLSQ
jgi:holliday junction DNA helicase RuvA